MSAYSVSSLSPSHSRQVLSAPCSRLVVVFPPLGPGSGSLGTWVDCIIQAPFLIKREPTEHSLWNLVIKLSFELFDRGQVIPETSGQGFRDAVIADRLSWSYLSPRPTRLSTCSTCCHYRVGPSHASAQPHRPTGLSFALLAFSASTLVSEGCNTSSILWRKGGFCQIWDNPNVVGLTRAAI